MKILIVDDHPVRYKPLIAEMEAIGIEKKSIDFAYCSADASELLTHNIYDLLILDVLIPLEKWDDDPSPGNSINLLYEISEGKELSKPGKVIGITSDIKVAGEVSKDFEEHTWSIIHYSISDVEWVKKIINCAKYLLNKQHGVDVKDQESVDLVLICALEEPELEAVLKLPWNWQVARPLDDLIFIRDGFFFSNGKKFTVAATFSSRMGMVATALKSFALISKLSPKVIGMTGICAGVKEKVSIGDVLFADPVWDFQSGKRVKDKKNNSFSIAPHQLYPDVTIRTHVEQLRSDKDFFDTLHVGYFGDKSFTSKLIIGPVASGSAVLADGETINEIKRQQRELIGVEMEIYGLYTAAANSSPAPKCFAFKGVCDFADPDKKDDAQFYASYASARVMQRLFEQFGYRILS